MPAKDIFHDCVKHALVKDGWTITDDPLKLKWGKSKLYVDLAAEKFLAAEKSGRKIAVEVKSFVGASALRDLEQALGQFMIYHAVLQRQRPKRILYLAVNKETHQNIFEEDVGRLMIEAYGIPIIVFDEKTEVVVRWIL